jgi:hypothetical protein
MIFHQFEPRPVQFLGIEEIRGYRLKCYSIVHGDVPFRREEFDGGMTLAANALPSPAVTDVRPGVGFVILHQGRTGNYLILSWWDNENELPTRVFVRTDGEWRPGRESESFCVWDLEVMWREREAYVVTVLCGKAVNEYLNVIGESNG